MTTTTDTLDNGMELGAEVTTATESLKQHRKRVQKKRKKDVQEPSLGRDIIGWLAIVGGIAWLLTLISFDPTDPSFFHRTSKLVPDNLLGVIGANTAAWCYQFTGFGSFLFPLCSIYLGVLCIRSKKVNDWFFQISGGMTLLLVFLTFLGSLPLLTIKNMELLPGGMLGLGIWRFFIAYLNPFGTYLFLFGVLGLAVLVATRLTLRDMGFYTMAFAGISGRAFMGLYYRLARNHEARERMQMRDRIIRRELDKMNKPTRRGRKKAAEEEDEDYFQPTEEEKAPPVIRAKSHPTGEVEAEEEEEPVHHSMDLTLIRSEDLDGIDDLPTDLNHEPAPARNAPRRAPKRKAPTRDMDSSDLDEPDHDDIVDPDGIKVNPMKRPVMATQEHFDFVQELEGNWVYPSSYLFSPPDESHKVDELELVDKAKALEGKFGEFAVTGQMREIHPGPVVTTYEFKPDAGIKYSKIVNLSDDLCLALGAESVRIDRMPGKSSIGMEVPNNKRELITFREMIETESFRSTKNKLLLSLGKTIDGTPFYADLAKMPHLLIAGQTGSGKSVGINAMICSILMRAKPSEVKMIMIDPKMVEMGIYRDIPHLLTPVVTDPLEASNALKWAVAEMEKRYRLLASLNFRNLDHYNKAASTGEVEAEEGKEPLVPLPAIVVFIDEMADLMMVARGEVEESIARLAQKSRAIGIHLVLATQRPSVDIITGVIKSNLPSRLAYRVAQKNDSRIILDTNGAESLLGKGDGLFLGPGTSRMVRIHAPYLSESEVLDLVKFLKNQGRPNYDHQVLKPPGSDDDDDGSSIKGKGKKSGKSKAKEEDPMYDKAARLVVRSGQASVSYLQRKLGLGYARAAKLVDMMEDDGIVGPNVGSKARDILVPADYFDGVDNRL